jgi:hypothetical protein
MPSPGRCWVTPLRPTRIGPPPVCRAGFPICRPDGTRSVPDPVQLNPRSHRIPPHLPRPSLPSWSDRADSDTLDIRFIQSRLSGSISSYSWTLHAFCSSSAKSFQLNTGFTRCPFGFASCNCPSNFSPSSRSPVLARTPHYFSITSQVCTGTPLLALPLSLLVWLFSLDSDTDSNEPGPPPPGQLTPSRITSHGPDPLSPIQGLWNSLPGPAIPLCLLVPTRPPHGSHLSPDAHHVSRLSWYPLQKAGPFPGCSPHPMPRLVPTPDATHSRRRTPPQLLITSRTDAGTHARRQ